MLLSIKVVAAAASICHMPCTSAKKMWITEMMMEVVGPHYSFGKSAQVTIQRKS